MASNGRTIISKCCGKKRNTLLLRYNSSIFLEEMRKTYRICTDYQIAGPILEALMVSDHMKRRNVRNSTHP
jgi:hypothetical protein